MFFVPFFLNSPRDRGYRLCIASWHSSVSGSCHLHGGHSAGCLLIHRDLLPFQTSAARGQCPGEHVCTASGPWGATDHSSRFAEFIDQLEMLRCFLPVCGVLCVDWLMPTCAQHVRLASLWVLEMYMPRVSYIRVERTGFIGGILTFCFLYSSFCGSMYSFIMWTVSSVIFHVMHSQAYKSATLMEHTHSGVMKHDWVD